MSSALLGKIRAGVLDPPAAAQATADPAYPVTEPAIEARYLYATVRTADGTVLSFTRRLAVDGGRGLRRLLVRSAGPVSPTLETLAIGRRAACGVDARLSHAAGTLTVTSAPDPGGSWFTAEVDADAISWSESDVLDLSGRTLGPGLQWELPGMRYAGWLYEVTGNALGREVRGVAGADTVWLPAGAALYADDPITTTGAARIWITFATSYGPDSAEYGHFLVGSDEGVAVTARDGTVSVHDQVTGNASADGASATITAPGRSWEFTRDRTGVVPEAADDPMIRAEGLVRSSGERRSPTAWMAALEMPRHS